MLRKCLALIVCITVAGLWVSSSSVHIFTRGSLTAYYGDLYDMSGWLLWSLYTRSHGRFIYCQRYDKTGTLNMKKEVN